MNNEDEIGHALIVGGTGMLRGVCLQLARDGWAVSVIARDERRLQTLADKSGGRIMPMPLDYRDSATLSAAIRARIANIGPISLVIAWIHDTAPEAARVIAETVAASASFVRFFHILGSATADPARKQPRIPAWAESHSTIQYHRIILGFVVENGRSRWLTDQEICDGVERAIANEVDEIVVGVIEPWDRRP